jgi:hypothetical protein
MECIKCRDKYLKPGKIQKDFSCSDFYAGLDSFVSKLSVRLSRREGVRLEVGKVRPWSRQQGCQIFRGTVYQNGGKYPKLPQIIPKSIQYIIKWQEN